MVEEARPYDYATLFIDEFVATFADALVDPVDPESELGLAPLRDGRRAGAAPRGADAVFRPLTVGIELGEHLPVVQLHRAEISVRDSNEALTCAPLFYG